MISVIIPVYRVESYLPQCVDSILAQSYPDLEVLLVEDGSPDRCGEICDEYAKRDARVRAGSATHGGLDIHSLAKSYEAHGFMYETVVRLYPDLKNYSQAFLLDAYLLKYNEALRKISAGTVTEQEKADLSFMRKAIQAEARRALLNGEIFWKTRLAYLTVPAGERGIAT